MVYGTRFQLRVWKRLYQYAPDMYVRWLTIFTISFIYLLADVRLASPMICTCTTFYCFFPGLFFHFRLTGACPVTTDLITRVDARTITPATTDNGIVLLLLEQIPPPKSRSHSYFVPTPNTFFPIACVSYPRHIPCLFSNNSGSLTASRRQKLPRASRKRGSNRIGDDVVEGVFARFNGVFVAGFPCSSRACVGEGERRGVPRA